MSGNGCFCPDLRGKLKNFTDLSPHLDRVCTSPGLGLGMAERLTDREANSFVAGFEQGVI